MKRMNPSEEALLSPPASSLPVAPSPLYLCPFRKLYDPDNQVACRVGSCIPSACSPCAPRCPAWPFA